MNLYQEEILDHYKHPRNKKRLQNPTYSVEAVNPLCGDTLGIEFAVEEGKITDIGFWGDGCAISQAAMSMLTEELIGEHVDRIKTLTQKDITDLLGVPIGPSRLKCALLPLKALESINLYE